MNGEYFLSLSVLNTEREKLINKQKHLETLSGDKNQEANLKKLKRQIAQIDFYCWYFSIFAYQKIQEPIVDRSKVNFLNYSKSTGDKVAITYYNIVNMKEILLKAFSDLKENGKVSDGDKAILREVYQEFKLAEPHYSVHTTIADEWKFLKESYSILQLCCEIADDYNKSANTELIFYKLCSRLLNLYNTPCVFNENNKIREFRRQNNFSYYIFTLSSGGQLICRGDFDMLVSAMKKNNIQLLTYKLPVLSNNSGEPIKNLSEVLSKNISNIVIAVDNDNYEDDVSFIEAILKFDNEKASEDRHNIYVDVSSLSNEAKESFSNMLEAKKEEFLAPSVFCTISNLNSTMLLGCAFSMLEKHLLRLGTPFNSYVISPVADDVTFDAQSCENLIFLEQSWFGNIKVKYISDWEYGFGSCFPSEEFCFWKE